MSRDVPASLWETDGDRYIATGMSRGPWDERHCHGGPVSALLARAVEHVEDHLEGAGAGVGHAWQIARLTVELTRPVHVGRPLDLHAEVERPGRKVSLVAAVLSDAGTEVARVRALRIRREHVDLPADADLAADVALAPPESAMRERVTWAVGEHVAFHSDACEHRFVGGSWNSPGPVEVWIRLATPPIEGEEPSGLQRVAAAADFGNGVSGSLPYDDFVFINPDLTVHLLRPPEGEWVGMRAASRYGSAGAGLAESELFDLSGRLGRSCQSLLVSAR